MEEQNKSGSSLFGTILIIIILIAGGIYYLSNKNNIEIEEVPVNQETMVEDENSNVMVEGEAGSDIDSIESDFEALDTDFSDLNPEDLDF